MTEERTFDWVSRHDERSRDYPVRAAIGARPVRRDKTWRTGPILDQGREGACVGYGWTAEALSTPVAVDLNRVRASVPRTPQEFAPYVYRTAQTIDEWEGADYSGTSVLAGAKTLKLLGLIKEYRWAFSIEDVTDAVLSVGPVVLGIEWYEGMYEAPGGVVRPFGAIVGGHCLTVVGYRVASPFLNGEDGFLLQNSWGTAWGGNGLALIGKSDLNALLASTGEACVPTRRSYGR